MGKKQAAPSATGVPFRNHQNAMSRFLVSSRQHKRTATGETEGAGISISHSVPSVSWCPQTFNIRSGLALRLLGQQSQILAAQPPHYDMIWGLSSLIHGERWCVSSSRALGEDTQSREYVS